MSTLMDFRYKRKYTAENGMDGQGSRKFGKSGKPLTIRVPRGTLVRDAETERIIKDMSSSEPYVLCRGGKGGWGNCHFATPTRQVPALLPKAGLPGESTTSFCRAQAARGRGPHRLPERRQIDAALGRFKARPKIANYHFTTLYPNLGVVYVDEGVSFVMADIPGIIEGAADGAGLGHDFSCATSTAAACSFMWSMSRAARGATRCGLRRHQRRAGAVFPRAGDAPADRGREQDRHYGGRSAARKAARARRGGGLSPLRPFRRIPHRHARTGAEDRRKALHAPAGHGLRAGYVPRPPKLDTSAPLNITVDDNTIVEGPWLERLMANVNFSDYESRMYFDKMLRERPLCPP